MFNYDLLQQSLFKDYKFKHNLLEQLCLCVCVSLCLSVSLSLSLSVSQSLSLSVSLSLCLSVFLSFCPFVLLSLCWSVSLCLSVSRSPYVNHLYCLLNCSVLKILLKHYFVLHQNCLFAASSFSIYLHNLSLCLSVLLSLCPSVYLSSVSVSFCLSLSVLLSFCLFISLPLCLFVYLYHSQSFVMFA